MHGPGPRSRRGEPRRVLRLAGVGDIINDAGRMPRGRVKHHPDGTALARFPARLAGCMRIRTFTQRAFGGIASSGRRGASLTARDAAPDASNLLDIVDAVGLFLEEELVEMSAQRGRGEGLLAVLAFAVLECRRLLSRGLGIITPCGALGRIGWPGRGAFVHVSQGWGTMLDWRLGVGQRVELRGKAVDFPRVDDGIEATA